MDKQMIIKMKKSTMGSVFQGMGKSLVMIAGLVMVLTACQTKAQGQVPDEVKASFESKYPGENDPDWKKDSNGNYESKFKKDGKHYRADFSPNGDWIETEQSIDKDDLPKIVRDLIKEQFDDYEIVEIEKVDHHSKGVFYDVEFKRDGEKKDIEFTADGRRLN